MSNSQRHLKGLSYAKYGYMFALPFIIIFLIFSLYPTLYTMFIGFTDMKGVGNETHLLEQPFENFKSILNNQSFIQSLKNTVKIWVMNFVPQMGLALLLTAWFTSRTSKLKGKGFFKVVFYMPNIITAATIAILFNTLFGYPKGPVNQLLMRRINDRLRIIYKRFCNEDSMSIDQIQALNDICHAYSISTTAPDMRNVLVLDGQGTVIERIPYTGPDTVIFVHDSTSRVIWESRKRGGRGRDPDCA